MAVFFVNGTEVNVPKNQKLLRYLRDELHLTSVKDGCSEGACGACTVLIDGEPCRACTPSTDALEGRHILTVEGLTDEEKKLYTYAYGDVYKRQGSRRALPAAAPGWAPSTKSGTSSPAPRNTSARWNHPADCSSRKTESLHREWTCPNPG